MPKVVEVLLYWYALLCARPFFRNWNLLLLHAGFRGLGVLNYQDDRISGERYVLQTFLPKVLTGGGPVLFDVGANEGEYSASLARAFPAAKLYAFEPHPATFARASRKLSGRAQLNNLAVGSMAGEVTLYDRSDIEGSEHASLYGDVVTKLHNRDAVAVTVQMTTLDIFAAANAIQQIDFLKIDTEGHEFQVLKGAIGLLDAGRLRYVQFEFNEMNAVSKVFLREFRVLLKSHRLYRILPNALLPIDSVPLTAEVFAFQNILAVPTSELAACGLSAT